MNIVDINFFKNVYKSQHRAAYNDETIGYYITYAEQRLAILANNPQWNYEASEGWRQHLYKYAACILIEHWLKQGNNLSLEAISGSVGSISYSNSTNDPEYTPKIITKLLLQCGAMLQKSYKLEDEGSGEVDYYSVIFGTGEKLVDTSIAKLGTDDSLILPTQDFILDYLKNIEAGELSFGSGEFLHNVYIEGDGNILYSKIAIDGLFLIINNEIDRLNIDKANKSDVYTKLEINIKNGAQNILIDQNKANIILLKNRVSNLETSNANINANIVDINSRIDTNISNISINTNKIAENKTAIDSNISSITELENVKADKVDVDSKNLEQDNKIDINISAITNLENVKADKVDVDASDTNLQNQIDSNKISITSLETDKANKVDVDLEDQNLQSQIDNNKTVIDDNVARLNSKDIKDLAQDNAIAALQSEVIINFETFGDFFSPAGTVQEGLELPFGFTSGGHHLLDENYVVYEVATRSFTILKDGKIEFAIHGEIFGNSTVRNAYIRLYKNGSLVQENEYNLSTDGSQSITSFLIDEGLENDKYIVRYFVTSGGGTFTNSKFNCLVEFKSQDNASATNSSEIFDDYVNEPNLGINSRVARIINNENNILDILDVKIPDLQNQINNKADTSYVDSENDAQNIIIDTNTNSISELQTTKADVTYVNNKLDKNKGFSNTNWTGGGFTFNTSNDIEIKDKNGNVVWKVDDNKSTFSNRDKIDLSNMWVMNVGTPGDDNGAVPKSYVDAKDALKANISDVYTKSEIDNLQTAQDNVINLKADKSYVDSENSNQNTIISSNTTRIANLEIEKVDADYVDSKIGNLTEDFLEKIDDVLYQIEKVKLPVGSIVISNVKPNYGTWEDLGELLDGQAIIGGTSDSNGELKLHNHQWTYGHKKGKVNDGKGTYPVSSVLTFDASGAELEINWGTSWTDNDFSTENPSGWTTNKGSDDKNRAWGKGIGEGVHLWKRTG